MRTVLPHFISDFVAVLWGFALYTNRRNHEVLSPRFNDGQSDNPGVISLPGKSKSYINYWNKGTIYHDFLVKTVVWNYALSTVAHTLNAPRTSRGRYQGNCWWESKPGISFSNFSKELCHRDILRHFEDQIKTDCERRTWKNWPFFRRHPWGERLPNVFKLRPKAWFCMGIW